MNQLLKDRKITFVEARALLNRVSVMRPRENEKYERLFASEMLRFISYLIKTTPLMTTLSPQEEEKSEIHYWLSGFNKETYDMACSALMTTAVDMFL